MARFPAHLRHAGAKANTRTGLHVHVGAADFTPDNIKNLVRTFYKQEELILKAAGTESNRIARYTRKTDHAFVDKICRLRTPTMEAINAAWFGRYNPHPYHYDEHRAPACAPFGLVASLLGCPFESAAEYRVTFYGAFPRRIAILQPLLFGCTAQEVFSSERLIRRLPTRGKCRVENAPEKTSFS